MPKNNKDHFQKKNFLGTNEGRMCFKDPYSSLKNKHAANERRKSKVEQRFGVGDYKTFLNLTSVSAPTVEYLSTITRSTEKISINQGS